MDTVILRFEIEGELPPELTEKICREDPVYLREMLDWSETCHKMLWDEFEEKEAENEALKRDQEAMDRALERMRSRKTRMDPRIIRLKDAAAYLGMDKNRFNAEVRPHLTEIPIGSHGIGFDRLDLDRWFEAYKARNGRPGHAMERSASWGRKSRQDSSNVGGSGMSRRQFQVREFEKALERVTSRKRSGI
jgi:hypothetical protein